MRAIAGALFGAFALCGTVGLAVAQALVEPLDPLSVVYIECESKNAEDEVVHTRGSGVIVDEEGMVLTAAHVLFGLPGAPLHDPSCRGVKGSRAKMPTHYMIARGRSQQFDAALLQFVEDPTESYAPVQFVNVDRTIEGFTVSVYGFPERHLGRPSRQTGTISNTFHDEKGFIGTGAMAVSGMSGGPVVLETGEVIGIIAGADLDTRAATVTSFAVLVAEVLMQEFGRTLQLSELAVAENRESRPGTGTRVATQRLPEDIRKQIADAVAAQLALNGAVPTVPPPPPPPPPEARTPAASIIPSVAGAEPRVESISDNSDYPYRTVARIILERENQVFTCSGFLVDPNFAITARHCLFASGNDQAVATDIKVIPGYRDGEAPYGVCVGRAMFATSPNPEDLIDLGIAGIALDCDVGQRTGFLGLKADDRGSGAWVTLLGYTAGPSNKLLRISLTRLPDQGVSDRVTAGMRSGVHYIGPYEALAGVSGSPILARSENGQIGSDAVAVMMSSDRARRNPGDEITYTSAPITPELLRVIESWIQESREREIALPERPL